LSLPLRCACSVFRIPARPVPSGPLGDRSTTTWALAILGGRWERGTPFFTTPLYAYFLALAYRFGGHSIEYIRFLNVLFGIGTVILTCLTARRLLGRHAAVAATALIGLCAAPVFYEWLPEKTTMVLFLTALFFFLLARASTAGSPSSWLPAGLIAGLACLGHTLLLVALPAVSIHVALNRGRTRGAAAKMLVLFTLGFMLGLAPATVHNWLQDRSFVPVCTTGGITFYIGNSQGNQTGRYVPPPFATSNAVSEENDFISEAERRLGRPLKPPRPPRSGSARVGEIGANPALALRRFWRRLRWTFGDAENTGSRTFEFYRERHRWLGPASLGLGLNSHCSG
jgi:hypothetical protein